MRHAVREKLGNDRADDRATSSAWIGADTHVADRTAPFAAVQLALPQKPLLEVAMQLLQHTFSSLYFTLYCIRASMRCVAAAL
jgi:hypothetical protein